jgi:hypothetical protein
MAETIIKRARHGDDRCFSDLGSNVRAELPVCRFPNGIIILEGKAGVQNAGNRHECGENRGR